MNMADNCEQGLQKKEDAEGIESTAALLTT